MSLETELYSNKTKEVTDDESKFSSFKKWLTENGAGIKDIYIKNDINHERSVYANKSIGSNTIIMFIPEKLIITDEYDSKFSLELQDKINIFNDKQKLKIVLYMLETIVDKNNFFQPYYRILPKHYSHLPIFWDKCTLNLLENSKLLKHIENLKKRLIQRYHDLSDLLHSFKSTVDIKDWLWAYSVVNTRCFSIKINNIDHTALVPFADMSNHSGESSSCRWGYSNVHNGFYINSSTEIKQHTQIFVTYGKKSNQSYMLGYGFMLQKYSHFKDCIYLDFEFPGYSLMIQKCLMHRNQNLIVTRDNFVDILLPIMRKFNINEDEFELYQHNSCNSIISKRNELATLKSISNIIKTILGRYSKTYEENIREVKQMKQFSNEWTAVKYIIKEKEMLLMIKKYAEIMVPLYIV